MIKLIIGTVLMFPYILIAKIEFNMAKEQTVLKLSQYDVSLKLKKDRLFLGKICHQTEGEVDARLSHLKAEKKHFISLASEGDELIVLDEDKSKSKVIFTKARDLVTFSVGAYTNEGKVFWVDSRYVCKTNEIFATIEASHK